MITSQRGRHGRSEYSILWSLVDDICAGLEMARLDKADIAARKLSTEIARIANERRGSK